MLKQVVRIVTTGLYGVNMTAHSTNPDHDLCIYIHTDRPLPLTLRIVASDMDYSIGRVNSGTVYVCSNLATLLKFQMGQVIARLLIRNFC
jgi:hypothetical protein